jgi:hypothetical protein
MSELQSIKLTLRHHQTVLENMNTILEHQRDVIHALTEQNKTHDKAITYMITTFQELVEAIKHEST